MSDAAWLLYQHDDGRHAVVPSAEAATFAHGDPAWHRVGPVEMPFKIDDARFVAVDENGHQVEPGAGEHAHTRDTWLGVDWPLTDAADEPVPHADAVLAAERFGSDYRLPTITELLAIVDYTRRNPAVDPDLFAGIKPEAYWASSPVVGHSVCARVVYFDYGGSGTTHRDYSARVRAVRAVPASLGGTEVERGPVDDCAAAGPDRNLAALRRAIAWASQKLPELNDEYERIDAMISVASHADPAVRQYQASDGEWKSFMDANHERNTIESGLYPIRNLYLAPQPPVDLNEFRFAVEFFRTANGHDHFADDDGKRAALSYADRLLGLIDQHSKGASDGRS